MTKPIGSNHHKVVYQTPIVTKPHNPKPAAAPAASPAPRARVGNPADAAAGRIGISSSLQKSLLVRALISSRPTPANLSASQAKGQTVRNLIPVSKRHTGLNIYDNLPTSDRPKGDLDRYRTVNLKNEFAVKKGEHGENKGKYFFNTNTEKKLGEDRYLDFSSKKKLKDGKVSLRGINGKYEVMSKERFKELSKKISDGDAFKFSLKPDSSNGNPIDRNLYDMTGKRLDELGSNKIKLNYGGERYIKGEKYYYAFAATTKSGSPPRRSGWVKASSLENEPRFNSKSVNDLKEGKPAPGKTTPYILTGGDIKAKNSKGEEKYGYYETDKNGNKNFIQYKVLPRVKKEASVKAGDYLKHDGVVNLGFNVAGVSNNTIKIDGNQPVTFHRAHGKDTIARINLFDPIDRQHAREKSVGKMTFVYGYVETPSGKNGEPKKQWGWIPFDALKAKKTS